MDISIDQVWSLKEESCRANNWKNEEVATLLNTIKSHNLMKGSPSIMQLGHILEPLMNYSRTAFQITGKLKNLRKSYLTCQKKGCTRTALRECPYYDMLTDIYDHESIENVNATNAKIQSEDIKLSSDEGIEKMLNVIKDLNLARDLTLQSFSENAIGLISKMLIARGVWASIEQVKSTLNDLRTAYIDFRQSPNFGKTSPSHSYFYELHSLWGSMSIPDFLIQNSICTNVDETEITIKKRGDQWPEDEIIVLLTSIKTLDLIDEASKNTEYAARKLKDALRNNGYIRTKYHIHKKLDNLRNSYLQAQLAKTADEAIEKFPYYHLYERIFRLYSSEDISNSVATDATDDFISGEPQIQIHEEDSIVFAERTKHSRNRAWSNDETILLLSLLRKLNLVRLIAHRLTFEIACKLVEPLRENGYNRSAVQIQAKLKNLRKAYYRCIKAGSTEYAIADCPFYEKLKAIFRKPGDRKLRTFRKLEQLGNNCINAAKTFTDHSYFNAVIQAKPWKVSKIEKENDGEQDNSKLWMPVETICDGNSGTVNEDDASGFEEVGDAETYADNVDNEVDDPFGESDAPADTGQSKTQNNPNNGDSSNKISETKCEIEKPESSTQSHSSRVPISRRARRNVSNRYSSKSRKNSPIIKSMRIVMAEVLRKEKLLQRRHHIWMERQFEIQRKHDREQRGLLVKELAEFRKAITSMPKL